jgi:hypothetical protein
MRKILGVPGKQSFFGSVEIPDSTSIIDIQEETDFHGYHEGGDLPSIRMAGSRRQPSGSLRCVTEEHEKRAVRLFSLCHSGGGNVSRRCPAGYLLPSVMPIA